MLMLSLDQAKPGMKLVMTVSNPEQPDHELLKPGYILDEPVLHKLRHLGVPFVYIDYPDLADLDRHLMPRLSPARQMIYNQIKQTIAAVEKTARPTVTFPDYYAATREMVLTLLQQGDHPIYLDILTGGLGTDAVNHATAVAQLSVTLGIRLEQYLIRQRSRLPPRHAREVINLGVAGMLHDIGKTKLPVHLQGFNCVKPPEEDADRQQWENHCRIGGMMLRNGIEPSAVAAVMQHHQRFDGNGFPKLVRPNQESLSLGGERIHVFARIIAAADLYDRLTLIPGSQCRRWPIAILHMMRTQYAEWVDPFILNIMPSVIPPFPPGSRLQLTDGTMAIVTKIDPDHPYHPSVRRVRTDGLTMYGDIIPTVDNSGLGIRALGNVPVEKMIQRAMVPLIEPTPATPTQPQVRSSKAGLSVAPHRPTAPIKLGSYSPRWATPPTNR